jgi:hypothetical protein
LSGQQQPDDFNMSNTNPDDQPEDLVDDALAEWLSEEATAAAVKKTVRTLRQWRRKGKGPPYTHFGRTVRYRKPALIEHFKQSEIVPVRERRP